MVPARRFCNQPRMPRCFAVADCYVYHVATVPTCATWEATSPKPCKWCIAGLEPWYPSSRERYFQNELFQLAQILVHTPASGARCVTDDLRRRGARCGNTERNRRYKWSAAQAGKSAEGGARSTASPQKETNR